MNIYEIEFSRKLSHETNFKKKLIQIPAPTPEDALIRLGQIYDDEVSIELIEIKQVK